MAKAETDKSLVLITGLVETQTNPGEETPKTAATRAESDSFCTSPEQLITQLREGASENAAKSRAADEVDN